MLWLQWRAPAIAASPDASPEHAADVAPLFVAAAPPCCFGVAP